MSLYVLGVNHQSASIAVRERLAFSAEEIPGALDRLLAETRLDEVAILSTCNRIEIYAAGRAGVDEARRWLARRGGIDLGALGTLTYLHQDLGAARHAFRVASGLDSMVLGEPQILGQMKQAMSVASHRGALGGVLHKLFQLTFRVAKEVRSRTQVGAHSVSMAGAAVRLAEQIFPSVAGQNILFIGAGEMIELCAAHFGARGPKNVFVANRTLERARPLAEAWKGQALSLEEIPAWLHLADIIVSCTASPLPILGKGTLEAATRKRRHRPVFIVDLAVPRDVEPQVAELDDVFLYTVDDLAGLVEAGSHARQQAAEQAEELVSTWTAEFGHWLELRQSVPLIRALRAAAEDARITELARARRRLARGVAQDEVLEELARGLTNKLMHGPSCLLHEVADEDRSQAERWLRRIYRVDGMTEAAGAGGE